MLMDDAVADFRGPEKTGTGPLNTKGPVPVLSGPLTLSDPFVKERAMLTVLIIIAIIVFTGLCIGRRSRWRRL